MQFLIGFIAGFLSFVLFNLFEERWRKTREPASQKTCEPISHEAGPSAQPKQAIFIGGIYRMNDQDDPFQTAATVRVIDTLRGADGKNYVQYVFCNGGNFGLPTSRDETSFRDIYPLHLK